MPLYIPRGGPRIFFVHIPKTAGSAVTNYLGKRFGIPIMSNKTTFTGEYKQRGFVSPPGHFTADDLVEFLPEDLDFCFAIVRDPLKRLISEFRYQKQGDGRLTSDFSTWLRMMFAAAKVDPRIYHNHIRPQSDFVPEGAEVFRLEDGFDGLIARLDEVSGARVDFGVERVNTSKKADGDVVLRRQDIEAVLAFYGPDYQRFGFDEPLPADYPADGKAALRDLAGRAMTGLVLAKEKRRWLR